MATVSTHVLDTAHGHPAAGLRVVLESSITDGWEYVAAGPTDDDGRVAALAGDDGVPAGVHRMTFDTGPWFGEHGVAAFYPRVIVLFEIADADAHHHVPLLLSPYGYSTYRGS